MGGSHSSRVVVVNDEKENAISVTRGVVERIKGEEEPTTVIEQPPVRNTRKNAAEHYEKIAEQNEELKRLLLNDLMISEATFTDEKPAATSKLCVDKQQEILNCLQNNKSEPLRCSTEMAEFTKCVYSQLDDKRKGIM